MNSRLYSGELRHRRSAPKPYQFTYGVYYFELDLDEIDHVARRIIPLSRNRFNVLAFFDRDHMTPADSARTLAPAEVPVGDPRIAADGDASLAVADAPCRAAAPDVAVVVRGHLASRGINPESVRVGLLTNTRVLGYVFNPVSFYFVRERGDGTLRTVIAEVHNTHGERHTYDLDRLPETTSYIARADKAFYVSPFIEMDARYEFDFRESAGGAYDIRIDEYQHDELFFQAQLVLSPRLLTNANVARMLARYPLVTLKTIALIHWQGLKLWLRGVKYQPWVRREARP